MPKQSPTTTTSFKLLFLLFFCCASTATVFACDCIPAESPALELAKYDAVFSGKVVRGIFYDRVDAQPLEIFKGKMTQKN